jgi:flavin reductase (DIM6/NTAB) family NADH-FMN oxidoreductase RutF
MIDPGIKRSLGQLTYGVNIVACRSGDLTRAYTSTWTYQLAFKEPIVGISISPKHDSYPLIVAEGWFTVSLLAGDQIEPAQYFSYPGHRFKYVGDYLIEVDGLPVVDDCVAWLYCEVTDRIPVGDHVLVVAEVTRVGEGRLKAAALTYSSRKGWRMADTPARHRGVSVRDKLLDMVEDAGDETDAGGDA